MSIVPGEAVDDIAAVAVMVTVLATTLLVVAPGDKDGKPKPEKGPATPAAAATVVTTLCIPEFTPPIGRVPPEYTTAAGPDEDDEPRSPTIPPPSTMTTSKTATASAFLDGIVFNETRFYD
jgi:hypothetical protein